MTPGPLDREPTPHVTPGPPDRELKMTSPDTTRHADDKDHKRGCIAHPRAQPKRQARHVKWADDLLQEMQSVLPKRDIVASAPIETTVSDFTHEFPMRALSAPEAETANAATNCYIAEPQHRLVQKLYTETTRPPAPPREMGAKDKERWWLEWRKCEARDWVADLLESSDFFEQPCMMPLLGEVPHKVRDAICAQFERTIADLQEVTAVQEARADRGSRYLR
jgi:hypothetical protein